MTFRFRRREAMFFIAVAVFYLKGTKTPFKLSPKRQRGDSHGIPRTPQNDKLPGIVTGFFETLTMTKWKVDPSRSLH